MGARERFFDTIKTGGAADGLLFIPITMMLAADEINVAYSKYATDYRNQLRGQAAISERYDIDHVSAISDPATEAADLGADVIFYDNQPPAINEANAVLAKKSSLAILRPVKPEDGRRMSNRLEVVRSLKEQLGGEKIIEGWIEGPTSEASDLRGINSLMMDLVIDPGFVRELMDFTAEVSIALARAQLAAGADIIGVGDAASSLVGPELYTSIIKPYQKRYIDEIHAAGGLVRLHICGNIEQMLPHMTDLGMDILDLDSMVSVAAAREYMGSGVVLSGNIDPVSVVKDGSPEGIISGLCDCFEQAGGAYYAVNAGCEIPRGTPAANMDAMRRFARESGAGV